MTHPLELILHINWTKILSLEIDICDDGEKWSTNLYFEIQRASSDLLLPSTKKICPERLNWPGRLAISEGAL